MTRLQLTLKRMQGTDLQAGHAGEELTERCLDNAQLAWIKTEQSRGLFSGQLRSAGGKRPDYLVGDAGKMLFLDAKCLSPIDADGREFALEVVELDKLETTGRIFGADVALLVWTRRGQAATFYLDWLSRFGRAIKIRGKDARSALFDSMEGVTFSLL